MMREVVLVLSVMMPLVSVAAGQVLEDHAVIHVIQATGDSPDKDVNLAIHAVVLVVFVTLHLADVYALPIQKAIAVNGALLALGTMMLPVVVSHVIALVLVLLVASVIHGLAHVSAKKGTKESTVADASLVFMGSLFVPHATVIWPVPTPITVTVKVDASVMKMDSAPAKLMLRV